MGAGVVISRLHDVRMLLNVTRLLVMTFLVMPRPLLWGHVARCSVIFTLYFHPIAISIGQVGALAGAATGAHILHTHFLWHL